MFPTISDEAAGRNGLVAATMTGGVPVGPAGITIFLMIFVAIAIYMAVSYFKRRK